MNPTIKSTLAILAGFLTVVILSVATDAILEATGIFPPPDQGLFITWMLLLAFGYRTLFNIAGGYVTASIAPANPERHAIILGCIGTVAGAVGVVVGWDLSEHWYPVALAVEAIPTCWLGGKLRANRNLSVA
jgi:putative Mn2+ efflux pump MntP